MNNNLYILNQLINLTDEIYNNCGFGPSEIFDNPLNIVEYIDNYINEYTIINKEFSKYLNYISDNGNLSYLGLLYELRKKTQYITTHIPTTS